MSLTLADVRAIRELILARDRVWEIIDDPWTYCGSDREAVICLAPKGHPLRAELNKRLNWDEMEIEL